MAKQRSRRLQKKMFLGEFSVEGLELRAEWDGEDGARSFIDFVDSMKLVMIGGFSDVIADVVIFSENRYDSVTEEQRAEILQWLEQNEAVKTHRLSSLVDLNRVLG